MSKLSMILDKVDRLNELIFNEPVDDEPIGVDIDLKCDDYILGLCNGMEVAIALLEDRQPKLLDEIEVDTWLDSNDLMLGNLVDLFN